AKKYFLDANLSPETVEAAQHLSIKILYRYFLGPFPKLLKGNMEEDPDVAGYL
ncbi:hypothetical protein HAX54_024007, partial [Datura stramonium]|nr:hypothetical protein [Datura stramonium]